MTKISESEDRCRKYEQLVDLLNEERSILLGETHGQVQSSQILGCLIEDSVTSKEQIIVSLELPDSPSLRIRNVNQSAGKGTSVANPELICMLSEWMDNPFVSFDYHMPSQGKLRSDGSFDQTDNEIRRADNIRKLLNRPEKVVVLAGWWHARNTFSTNERGERDGYAGYYLVEDDIVSVRLISSQGGTARNCLLGEGCGLHKTSPSTLSDFSHSRLVISSNREFDFFFDVGEFTPSSESLGLDACPEYETWLQTVY